METENGQLQDGVLFRTIKAVATDHILAITRLVGGCPGMARGLCPGGRQRSQFCTTDQNLMPTVIFTGFQYFSLITVGCNAPFDPLRTCRLDPVNLHMNGCFTIRNASTFERQGLADSTANPGRESHDGTRTLSRAPGGIVAATPVLSGHKKRPSRSIAPYSASSAPR